MILKDHSGRMREIIRVALNTLSHLIFTPTLGGRYYYLDFKDEEIGTRGIYYIHTFNRKWSHIPMYL